MPIPFANHTKNILIENLTEAIIYLVAKENRELSSSSTSLMIAYLEQWLNGLVYELFFPEENYMRKGFKYMSKPIY